MWYLPRDQIVDFFSSYSIYRVERERVAGRMCTKVRQPQTLRHMPPHINDDVFPSPSASFMCQTPAWPQNNLRALVHDLHEMELTIFLNLPLELFQAIMEEIVVSQGLYKAVKLRLVCSM